jgi:mono/diheme cytochrome c family protein
LKRLFWIITLFVAAPALEAASEQAEWAPFVEPNFPFFSSVLDARNLGPTNNLTPRGLILNFPQDLHVCFDIDLLRVAAVWQGPGVTPVSMAQGSYERANWGKKAPEGQKELPQIAGAPIFLNPLTPGVLAGSSGDWKDPRDPGPDPREVGRGPLPGAQFEAIEFKGDEITLEYTVNSIKIRDSFNREGNIRLTTVGPHKEPIRFLFESSFKVLEPDNETNAFTSLPFGKHTPRVNVSALNLNDGPPKVRQKFWGTEITTSANRATTNDAYRIEHLALPLQNPWRRNVRLADLDFFPDGRAAAVTFDGDIWLIDGLSGDLKNVRWRRFASGLHEPLSLAIKQNQIYVFDRNGIWRIVDTDGNGEADRYEMFCNRFTQTAETREFANSMKPLPDGAFVIGKPGQSGSTVGKDSGKILRVSADGKEVSTLATGFRQPFLGVNPRTGSITASDQQGHYIPTTPIQIIRDAQYYGFRATFLPKEKASPAIAEPLVWIPHSINASAANEVWLSDKGMGPLNNTLIHLGYYRSEIFNVLWNGGPNAAVVSFTRDLRFAPLNAKVHPIDGKLFVVGFQLWGAEAPEISGLARISYLEKETVIPREILPTREGILLQLNTTVAEASIRPENFSAERWNYRRSPEYGSPHFKLDGSKGQEPMFASSAYVAKDHRSIFIGLPDMRPVMQMRLGWSLKSESGLAMNQNAYLTPRDLKPFDPVASGFGPIKIDLTPRTNQVAESIPITVEEGKRLSELMGCVACHSNDGTTQGKVGPTWKALAGSRVKLNNGQTVLADTDYLRESIRVPNAKIVKDFDKSDAGMPSYEGVLQDAQIEAIILYIQSLTQN